MLSINSCQKDDWNTDKTFKLTFSSDTILFDTVFTSVGSVTQYFTVHNPSNKKIKIGNIQLARGKNSPFSINIDGVASYIYQNLEIAANDSTYIFVKVTIDPNLNDNPLIQTDSLLFTINGQLQQVKLVAWGQDAYFYKNAVFNENVTLSAQKPHVFYGNLTLNVHCKLTLPAGAKLYFHKGSGIIVKQGASLEANGIPEKPVIMRGDRLDKEYKDVSGMWEGIHLQRGSLNNRFTYVEICNSAHGIMADSIGINNEAPLVIYNSLINNVSENGLALTHSNALIANCQITNCGVHILQIENGGSYDIRHCTLANYWSASARRYASVFISNYYTNPAASSDLTKAYFGNCIITGRLTNEINFSKAGTHLFNAQFDHCFVKWTETADYKSFFNNCLSGEIKFIDALKSNFQLDSGSPAIDAALLSVIQSSTLPIEKDRKDVARTAKPDMGAYEKAK